MIRLPYRSRAKTILALVAAPLLMLLLGVADAQQPAPRDRRAHAEKAAAATLMRGGVAALAAGDLATADRILGEAFQRWPSPELLYHLGILAAKKGELLEAHDLLRRYQSDPASTPDAAMAQQIQRILAQPRPPAGKVLVLSDSGALLRVDNRLVGSLPLVQPLLLSPTPHTISVTFPEQVLTAQVDVPVGRMAELRVSRDSKAVLVTLLPAYILLPDYQGLAVDTEHQIDDAIEHALQSENKSVLRRDLALRKAPELSTCLETLPCQDQLAAKNDVDGLLAVRVETAQGTGSHRVALRLLDTATGDFAGHLNREVEPSRLLAQLQKDVSQLLSDSAARTRGILQVRTEPAGAELSVDDRALGQTPYLRPSFTGRYELVIHKPGYDSIRQQIEVAEGRTTQIIIGMARDMPEPPPPRLQPPVTIVTERSRRPRPTWRLILAGAGLSAGALVLGFGINALQFGTSCLDPGFTNTPGALCGSRLMPAAFGGSMITGGLLLIGGGISLAAFPGRREKIDRYTFPPAEPAGSR